jgi:hypothetical protein
VTGRTVRVVRADGPRVTNGRSEKGSRPSSSTPRIMDGLCPVLRRSASNRDVQADNPPNYNWPETPGQTDRNEDAQEHVMNTKHPKPTGSTRTIRAYQADCPPGANRRGNSRPRARTRAPYHLSFHGSPKRLKLLRKDLGKM